MFSSLAFEPLNTHVPIPFSKDSENITSPTFADGVDGAGVDGFGSAGFGSAGLPSVLEVTLILST